MFISINTLILILALAVYLGGAFSAFYFTMNIKFAAAWPMNALETAADLIRKITGKEKV